MHTFFFMYTLHNVVHDVFMTCMPQGVVLVPQELQWVAMSCDAWSCAGEMHATCCAWRCAAFWTCCAGLDNNCGVLLALHTKHSLVAHACRPWCIPKTKVPACMHGVHAFPCSYKLPEHESSTLRNASIHACMASAALHAKCVPCARGCMRTCNNK